MNRLGVLPPPWRKGNPGRPSNYARKKGRYEAASSSTTRISRLHRVMTCSNCKQGCMNPFVEEPPKKPRGRPRKAQEPRNVLFGQGLSQGFSQGVSHGQTSQGSQGVSQRISQGLPSQASGAGQGPQGQGLHGWRSWFECST